MSTLIMHLTHGTVTYKLPTPLHLYIPVQPVHVYCTEQWQHKQDVVLCNGIQRRSCTGIHTGRLSHTLQVYMYMYKNLLPHYISIHLCIHNKRGALLSIHLLKQSDTSLSLMKSSQWSDDTWFKIITVAKVIGTLSGQHRQLARAQKFAALNVDSN